MQKFLQDVNIGKNIQRLRKERGLSQKGLAAKLQLRGRNMSNNSLGHIERGSRNIYISDFILIKEILQVSYEELFEGLESGR